MPPRIQQRVSNPLLPFLSSPSSTRLLPHSPCSSHTQQSAQPFSSTQTTQTQQRAEMFAWLNTQGKVFKEHTPNSTNYLSDVNGRERAEREGDSFWTPTNRPFPNNRTFVSESVLSEKLRNEIYERVVVKKRSVRTVSSDLGVDMRRIAAVCRLVEMEKRMRAQGKPLALPYARTIHEMVPTTPLYDDAHMQRQNPHESINDLPSHRLTETQIFYPVSESRHFTRVDAGRVFSGAPARPHEAVAEELADPTQAVSRITQNPQDIETVGKGDEEMRVLQPADVRIPHPTSIAFHRDRVARPNETREVQEANTRRILDEEKAEKERKKKQEAARERHTLHVKPQHSRFEFRFKDAFVTRENIGTDGRGEDAPGRRYGIPSHERKKGQVKIPTQVEV
ncbi:eukaryotic mitochondrial regulator protein-domain-containing protein [Aspergillus unguis]